MWKDAIKISSFLGCAYAVHKVIEVGGVSRLPFREQRQPKAYLLFRNAEAAGDNSPEEFDHLKDSLFFGLGFHPSSYDFFLGSYLPADKYSAKQVQEALQGHDRYAYTEVPPVHSVCMPWKHWSQLGILVGGTRAYYQIQDYIKKNQLAEDHEIGPILAFIGRDSDNGQLCRLYGDSIEDYNLSTPWERRRSELRTPLSLAK